jgi:hypothetical protein
MNAGSLRARLLIAAALSIIAALAVAVIAITWLFERYAEARVERELTTYLQQMASLVEIAPDGSVTLEKSLADPRFEQPLSGLYWQISKDGQVALASSSLWDETLQTDPNIKPGGQPLCLHVPGPGDKPHIVAQRAVIIGANGRDYTLLLAAAADETELSAAVADFRRELMLSLGILGTVLILAAWLQVRIGLQPLARLQRRLGLVRAGTQERLDGGFPDEVMPLVDELNELLDAQQRSIERARARAGDLAHGLKTPITVLGSIASELAMRGQVGPAGEVNQQVSMMRKHVERELARARVGIGHVPVSTDAGGAIRQLIAAMRRMPRGGEIDWVSPAFRSSLKRRI